MKSQQIRFATPASLLLLALTSSSVFATNTQSNDATEQFKKIANELMLHEQTIVDNQEAILDHENVLNGYADHIQQLSNQYDDILDNHANHIEDIEKQIIKHEDAILDHQEILNIHHNHITEAEEQIIANQNTLGIHKAEIIDNKAVLQEHANNIQALQESKASLEEVNAFIADTRSVNEKTLNAITQQNEQLNAHYNAITKQHDLLVNHGDALTQHDKLLNKYDSVLHNHADRIEDLIARKAEKVDLSNKADTAQLTRVENLTKNNANNITAVKKQTLNHTAHIQRLDTKVNQLDKKMRKGLATQSALNGLFQPYSVGKMNISAAMGGYKSDTALAVGVGYRYNENVATKAGVSMSTGGDKAVSYNVGVNYEW